MTRGRSVSDRLGQGNSRSMVKQEPCEQVMPADYDPTMEEEEEYLPPASRRKRGRTVSDHIEAMAAKKPRPETPKPRKASAKAVKVEPSLAEAKIGHECVLGCEEEVDEEESDMKYHYAMHYYRDPVQIHPVLRHLEPGDRAVVEKCLLSLGQEKKYHCLHTATCTSRRMAFREFTSHNLIHHQQLRALLAADPRPAMATVLARLYPLPPPTSYPKPPPTSYPQPPPTSYPPPLTSYPPPPPATRYPPPTPSPAPAPRVRAVGRPGRDRLLVEDTEEDVDDPREDCDTFMEEAASAPASSPARAPARSTGRAPAPAPLLPTKAAATSLVEVDRMHDCLLCTERDGRNMNLGSGLVDIRYHYAVCYYNRGEMFAVVDPGEENRAEGGGVKEEILRFRYTCAFPKCTKKEGKVRTMGYKEYAIHCGHEHSVVELAMAKDQEHDMAMVREVLAVAREKEGGQLVMPRVQVEETHVCLLCNGKNPTTGKDDKEAQALSFSGDKALTTRYHYAQCYYNKGVYWDMYKPGPQNPTTKDGRPGDELGARVKYSCDERGCDATRKRKMGYKEYCIHTSNSHGGLLKVLEAEARQELRLLLPSFRQIREKK